MAAGRFCIYNSLKISLLLLILFHHHLASFIDIAAAEGDDQIAGLGVLLDPVGGFLQAVHQHGAGDLCCQLCAGNGGVVGLAAAMMGSAP